MIKIITSITISLIITINCLSAQVRFDLRFTDPEGTGFNNPANKWMRQAVKESADILGNSIQQNAFVTIEIISKNDIYADSDCILKNIESFAAKKIAIAMDKILNEDDKFSGIWEGKIRFNTNSFSNYDTLRRVAIHEFTHTLGFVDLLSTPNVLYLDYYKSYTDWDLLMVDNEGNPLVVDQGSFSSNFQYNYKFNFSSDVFACGPNIKKRNNGECIKLYNSPDYSPSSFCHLDTTTYPKNILTHQDTVDGYPLWNKYEIGIMEDLGYQIDWENYCQFVDNLFFKPTTISIDMEAIKGNNCYFKLNKGQKDFPAECASSEIFNDNFSAEFGTGYLLQLFLNDHVIHEFNSIENLKSFQNIHIIDKDYYLQPIFRDNTLHLTFNEINPIKPKKSKPIKNKKKNLNKKVNRNKVKTKIKEKQ